MDINFSPTSGEQLLRHRARVKLLNSEIEKELSKPANKRKDISSYIEEKTRRMSVINAFLDI